MRSIMLMFLLTAPIPAAATICATPPLDEQLREAKVVFVAVIAGALSSEALGPLKNGDNYRVNYSFLVRERIKGESVLVTSLFTINTYRAYDTDIEFQGAETRLLPGDNVLVATSERGDVQIASCSASRPWHPSHEQLSKLRSL